MALALAAPVAVAATLELEASAALDQTVTVRLVATNTGTEGARDVTPAVAYEHQAFDGAPVNLAPGVRHEWQLSLPPPARLGRLPITIRVRHIDASGTARMTPIVTLVSSAGAPPDPVELSLSVGPLARTAAGRVLLDNPDAAPVAGRLFLVLPGGTRTEPESLPVQIAARGRTTVPLVVENTGLPAAAAAPVFALFEHTTGGVAQAVLARSELRAESGVAPSGTLPLAVGLVVLAAAVGLLLLALHRSAASTRS